MTSAVEFYNLLSRKSLVDLVHGNPRTEAAIVHALRWIPGDATRILDIGCGIGWSSWEIKRRWPGAQVLGVDLSPRMVGTARQLFEAPGLDFQAQDITAEGATLEDAFEAIVMLDVYEHIPMAARAALHRRLAQALAPDGVLILSCPTPQHQAYLRAHEPDGLQPVDEDVTEDDLRTLAEALGGRVAHYEPVSIWRPGDYLHAAIARKPDVGVQERVAPLEPQPDRAQRVRERLGVRVLRDGAVVSDRGAATVCVVAPEEGNYSETFIRAHLARLPARVVPLHGGTIAHLCGEEGPLIPPFTMRRHLRHSLARRLRGETWDDYLRGHIREHLQARGVDVVLAEYGPTGVMMLDVCREARIPLVVHFHGFDAYREEVLRGVGQRYPQLFEQAAALIAVSRDMEGQLLGLGAPREKVHYNPCGVDVALFSGAQPERAGPRFVGVGRFVDKKAPLLTLAAFARALEAAPEARLLMIGDGPLWEASRQMARVWGIAHAVELPGALPHPRVAAAMQGGRAFVQHSVRTSAGDSEGTPVSVLEACASGLPVVATRHAGIPDVVLEGETGLLVAEGDVEGMAQAMIRLAREPELAARMGRAGRERVCAEFSMEKSIANLWRILEAAIEGKR